MSAGISSRSRDPSPPPPSTPSVRYFDLLPTETIQTILGSLSETFSFPYRHRLATLRSLCLTSRRLQQIAHPQLLADIHLVNSKEVEQKRLHRLLRNNSLESLKHVRKVSVCSHLDLSSEWLTFAAEATGLKELRCLYAVTALTAFLGSNIATLTLSSLVLRPENPLSFPLLQRLRLSDVHFSGFGRGHIPFYLPELRHLVCAPFHPHVLYVDFITSLAPQLASVTIEDSNLANLPSILLTTPSLTLLSTHRVGCRAMDDTLSDLLRHFHLAESLANGTDSAGPDKVSTRLDLYQCLLFTEAGENLETLYLSSSMRSPQHDAQAQRIVEALIATCRRRQIELVWEDSREPDTFKYYAPPAFMRRAEKHRSKVLRIQGSCGAG